MTDFANADLSMLQVHEVARLLKVSTKTVRRWIAANELAVVRFGRSVRVSQAELARFVAARASNNSNDAVK